MPWLRTGLFNSSVNRWLTFVSVLVWVVVVVVFVVLVLSLTEPPPLRYTNVPFPVLQASVTPGEIVQFVSDRCTDDALVQYPFATSIHRNLVNNDNGLHTNLGDSFGMLGQGCAETVATLQIPSDTLPGSYHIEGFVEVSGRFRANYRVLWQTSDFIVEEIP